VSVEQERDESVERLLRQSLRQETTSAAPGPCLDAETLAAWADGSLSGSPLTTVEAHVSECSRCQAMVAALVKSAAAVPPPEPRGLRSWRLGWLVPLTAGAAAIALWFALPSHEPPAARPSENFRIAPSDGRGREVQEPIPKDRAFAPAAAGDERRGSSEARQPSEEKKAETTNSVRSDGREFAASQTPSKEPETAREATVDRLGKVAVPASPPAELPDARAPASATATRSETFAVARLAERAPREIASPDPSIRWRLGAAGSVQYSSNGGSAWEALSSGVTADLIAGAAPSSTVCWVVGRAGTVLLTTDGRRWQRVAFPEAVDLTAVQASDARSATVTTADGRTLRTTDGGATWLPLQGF
jgi:hypothetical protein